MVVFQKCFTVLFSVILRCVGKNVRVFQRCSEGLSKIFQTNIQGISFLLVLWLKYLEWCFRLLDFSTELIIGVQSVPKWVKMSQQDLK